MNVLQADRDGQAAKLADMYEASQLKEENDNMLFEVSEQQGRGPRNSISTLNELAVKTETVNTFWWGFYILIKVRSIHVPNYFNDSLLLCNFWHAISHAWCSSDDAGISCILIYSCENSLSGVLCWRHHKLDCKRHLTEQRHMKKGQQTCQYTVHCLPDAINVAD